MNLVRKLFARWICGVTGHTRGRRISAERVACRRCGAEWTRATRKKAQP